MNLLSKKVLTPLFLSAALGAALVGGNVLNSYNEQQREQPVTAAPEVVEEPAVATPDPDRYKISAYDIMKDYVELGKHAQRMLLFNPDGEDGIFETDVENIEINTNRQNLYKQMLQLSDQLIADGVTSPERILGVNEGQLRGENPFMEPHTAFPHDEKEHQHYSIITPYPNSNSSHQIEQTLSHMLDPTILLSSPYKSLSHETYVGLHEIGHGLENMLLKFGDEIGDHRHRLMAEAAADCFAMLTYEHASIKYGDLLEGEDGEFTKRIADLRTIAVLQMVLASDKFDGSARYFVNPYTDSFQAIVKKAKQDGTLEEMTFEDMAIMARDHVLHVSETKMTQEYIDEIATAIFQQLDELKPLTFKEQTETIRAALADGKFKGPAKAFFDRYVDAVDNVLSVQPVQSADIMANWEADLLQKDQYGVDQKDAWVLEAKFINMQMGSFFGKVAWVRDHQGPEAARELYQKVMNGEPEDGYIKFADRAARFVELAKELGIEKELKLEKMTTAPEFIVRLNVEGIIDEAANDILGEDRGRVAIVDMNDTFSVDKDGKPVYHPEEIAPSILKSVAGQMLEDKTDEVPNILAQLKQGIIEGWGQRAPVDSFINTFVTTTEDGHKYASFASPPSEMSAHQIEQRISLTYNPDLAWVSPVSSESYRAFIAMRSLMDAKFFIEYDEDNKDDSKAKPAKERTIFDLVDFSKLEDDPYQRLVYNATLDCFALLAYHQASLENPGDLNNVTELGDRLASLRDLSIIQTMFLDNAPDHAFDYDTSRFIERFVGYISFVAGNDTIKDLSQDDMQDLVYKFISSELRNYPSARLEALYKSSAPILGQEVEINGEKVATTDMTFAQRRHLIHTQLLPTASALDPDGDFSDLVDRINSASWDIVSTMPSKDFIEAWKQDIMPLNKMTKDQALRRIILEENWISTQEGIWTKLEKPDEIAPAKPAVQNETTVDNGGPHGRTPVRTTTPSSTQTVPDNVVSAEQRLALLQKFKEQLLAEEIFYTAEEAREILRSHLKEITLTGNGRVMKVPVTPDMIAEDGKHIIVPPGTLPNVPVPVVLTVPSEFIASIDPNAEKRRQAQSEENNQGPRALTVELPDGGKTTILVDQDMISEDGDYVTLPPGRLPPTITNVDEETKIFITKDDLKLPEQPKEDTPELDGEETETQAPIEEAGLQRVRAPIPGWGIRPK